MIVISITDADWTDDEYSYCEDRAVSVAAVVGSLPLDLVVQRMQPWVVEMMTWWDNDRWEVVVRLVVVVMTMMESDHDAAAWHQNSSKMRMGVVERMIINGSVPLGRVEVVVDVLVVAVVVASTNPCDVLGQVVVSVDCIVVAWW